MKKERVTGFCSGLFPFLYVKVRKGNMLLKRNGAVSGLLLELGRQV